MIKLRYAIPSVAMSALLGIFIAVQLAPKHMHGYVKMCQDKSLKMCHNYPITGKMISNEELGIIANTLLNNFTPVYDRVQYQNEKWHYNTTVNEPLTGDCEDVSMTFISHVLGLGVSADKVHLIISKKDGFVHAHARVGNYDFYKIDELDEKVILTMSDVSEFKRIEL